MTLSITEIMEMCDCSLAEAITYDEELHTECDFSKYDGGGLGDYNLEMHVILNKRDMHLALLIKILHEKYHSSGGNLHIILDDNNVDDHDIIFCRDWITKLRAGTARYTWIQSGILTYSEPETCDEKQMVIESKILDILETMSVVDRLLFFATEEVYALDMRGWEITEIKELYNLENAISADEFENKRMETDPDFKIRVVMARLTDGEI